MGSSVYAQNLKPVSSDDLAKALDHTDPTVIQYWIDRLDKAGFMVIKKPAEPTPLPTGE